MFFQVPIAQKSLIAKSALESSLGMRNLVCLQILFACECLIASGAFMRSLISIVCFHLVSILESLVADRMFIFRSIGVGVFVVFLQMTPCGKMLIAEYTNVIVPLSINGMIFWVTLVFYS